MNKNLDSALQLLSPIQAKHSQTGLTWADLIVLAGTTALEVTNNNLSLPFCAGRVDDTEGRAWEYLEPRITGNFSDSLVRLKDYISVMGLTQREFAALLGAGHVIGEDRDCAGLYCRYGVLLYLLLHLNNFFFTNELYFCFVLGETPLYIKKHRPPHQFCQTNSSRTCCQTIGRSTMCLAAA